MGRMLDSVPTRVPLDELPDSIRTAGLTNWFREPLDDAIDQRRRLMMPPAVALLGTPAAEFDETLSDQAQRPDTIAMMGDNPNLPKMPERPTLADFFRLRLQAKTVQHVLQSAHIALANGMNEKVV